MSDLMKILWELRPKGTVAGMRDMELISYRDTLVLMHASSHYDVNEYGVDIKEELSSCEDEILRRMRGIKHEN